MTRAGGAAFAVGLDVGGSAIKAGAVAADGTILATARREASGDPTSEEPGFDGTVERLGELFEELRGAGDGEPRVGVGVPGLLDRAAGRVTSSPNLAWLAGRPLRDALLDRLGLAPDALAIENDANAAALGECWLGAGRRFRDALVVTLGTGVGGGLVLAGELWIGAGLAGEIGHVRVDPEGPPCGCGGRGCVEQLASATAARRRAREAGLPDDLERLADVARAGAGPERALLEAIGADLGVGLAAAVNLLDLRAFVIGGGFSAAFDVLEPGVRAGLARGSYGERLASLALQRAELGAEAGWVGAARVALGSDARPARTP